MSPRGSKSGSEPQPDIYTGLLFVAVASLVTGIALLAIELSRYQWIVSP